MKIFSFDDEADFQKLHDIPLIVDKSRTQYQISAVTNQVRLSNSENGQAQGNLALSQCQGPQI